MDNNKVSLFMSASTVVNKVVVVFKTHHRWRKLASAFWYQGNRGLQTPEHQRAQSSSSGHGTSSTPSSRLMETSTLKGNKLLSIIPSNEIKHIFYGLCCCNKTFPLDGRRVLFCSQTYVSFCFSLLRALKTVVLQMAKRGWINGQNRVILTGQLQPLILTYRFRVVMLCGEEKLIYLCCSVTISLEWSTIYSRCLTRLALVGDNDVFGGFRAGILTKHRTHHRNMTLLSILALRHHFLTIKTHSDWNSLIIMSFILDI